MRGCDLGAMHALAAQILQSAAAAAASAEAAAMLHMHVKLCLCVKGPHLHVTMHLSVCDGCDPLLLLQMQSSLLKHLEACRAPLTSRIL